MEAQFRFLQFGRRAGITRFDVGGHRNLHAPGDPPQELDERGTLNPFAIGGPVLVVGDLNDGGALAVQLLEQGREIT
jgi:hypothetical protein